jgi:hypothetical protein
MKKLSDSLFLINLVAMDSTSFLRETQDRHHKRLLALRSGMPGNGLRAETIKIAAYCRLFLRSLLKYSRPDCCILVDKIEW